MAALLLPLAISARTSRSRAVSAASGERSTRTFAATSGSTIFGVQHGAAGGDRLDRRHQLRAVVDALLEQIGAALRAGLQQGHRVRGFGVVAQDDDADVGMLLAQQHRRADALVGAVGGIRMSVTTTSGRSLSTASSSEGTLAVDRLQELGQVTAGDHHLQLRLGGQDTRDPLTDDDAVVGQRDRHCHRLNLDAFPLVVVNALFPRFGPTEGPAADASSPASLRLWRGLRGSGGCPARVREGDQAPVVLVPELESHGSQTVP